MSLMEGRIKWERRWRQNNDREHGEDGPQSFLLLSVTGLSPREVFQES